MVCIDTDPQCVTLWQCTRWPERDRVVDGQHGGDNREGCTRLSRVELWKAAVCGKYKLCVACCLCASSKVFPRPSHTGTCIRICKRPCWLTRESKCSKRSKRPTTRDRGLSFTYSFVQHVTEAFKVRFHTLPNHPARRSYGAAQTKTQRADTCPATTAQRGGVWRCMM